MFSLRGTLLVFGLAVLCALGASLALSLRPAWMHLGEAPNSTQRLQLQVVAVLQLGFYYLSAVLVAESTHQRTQAPFLLAVPQVTARIASTVLGTLAMTVPLSGLCAVILHWKVESLGGGTREYTMLVLGTALYFTLSSTLGSVVTYVTRSTPITLGFLVGLRLAESVVELAGGSAWWFPAALSGLFLSSSPANWFRGILAMVCWLAAVSATCVLVSLVGASRNRAGDGDGKCRASASIR